MLKSLVVKDFALVEQLELDFKKGMISLTGETGAGKSILLGAIGLIKGDKPKKNAIRNGQQKAIINSIFDISYLPKVKDFLVEHGLADDDNNNDCYIRRIIHASGRSSAYINDSPINIKTLKSLGEMLVEIHGQHQHQNLSKKKAQLDTLDSFSGLKEKRKEVSVLFKEWKDAEKNAIKIKADVDASFDKFQLLTFKRDKVVELDLQKDEFDELEEEEKHLSSAESVLNSCDEANQLLNDGQNGQSSIDEMLSNVLNLVKSLDVENKDINEVVEMLESAKINIEESIPCLSKYKEKFEVNPARLLEVQSRIKDLNSATEYFHCLPEELLNLEDELEKEINELNYSEDAVEEAEKRVALCYDAFIEKAIILSKSREQKSSLLSADVNSETVKLNLAEDILKIEFKESHRSKEKVCSYYGIDEVDFLIRPNLGQEYQKISDVASGGELSRLSLAVQVVSFKNEKKPTMIFDEVDTGLSGETGNVVGNLLRRVGEIGQVMCVTHLPQVAAQGHSHYFVSKSNEERDGEIVTISNIQELNYEDRVVEVARMIGGNIGTKESIDNAREMFKLND